MKPRYLILLLCIATIGCTSTRWVVEDEYTVDESEGEKISSEKILQKAAGPEMDQPVLSLELYEVQELEYPERLLARRYVQQYRPRYGIWALGLGTSALMLSMAHTDWVVDMDLTRNEQILMNTSAAVIGTASLFSMRPVGEPMDTGAEQMLTEVGTAVRKDTVRLHNDDQQAIQVHIYDDEMLYETETELQLMAGSVDINLLAELGMESIESEDPVKINVEFEFEGRQYSYSFDPEDFMARYAEVTEDNAPLRSGPNMISGNILNNLAYGAQIPITEERDNGWFQVDYGVSHGYVHRDDARMIWKAQHIDQDDAVIETTGEFGEIDIEQDIPEADYENEHTLAIIWANDSYSSEDVLEVPNLDRSVELVETYMHRRLGIPEEQVITYRNTEYDDVADAFESDSLHIAGQQIKPDTTNVIIYYLGHGLTGSQNDETRAYLLPSDYTPDEEESGLIELRGWLDQIAKVQSRSTTVILDTDFRGSSVSESLEHVDDYGDDLSLQEEAMVLTDQHPNAAILFATEANQVNGRYISEDGRTNNYHGIFTYYLFRALRESEPYAGMLFRSLERNVNFTSRRIHDRAQYPVMFGEEGIRFIHQPESD